MTSTQNTPRLLALVAGGALTLGACGQPPVIDYANRPAPPPVQDFEDRAPDVNVLPDGTASLTGQVKNWVSLAIVDGATIKTYGLNPPVEGAADGTGGYEMQVQAAGVFWAYAYKAGYAYTYDYVRMPAGDYNKTLYVVSDADLAAMAATYGVTQNPACAVVVSEVRNAADQGQPDIENVALAGVDYQGPYFLGAQGQPQAGRTYTSESGRVVFFNVCNLGTTQVTSGFDVQLSVSEPGYTAQPQYLKVFPGAVTRGVVSVVAGNEPDPNPDPEPVLVDFATDIYPIFVRNACAACHVQGGAAAGTGLYFDGPPDAVYALLRQGTARVNLTYPAQSYVLTKPLLEDPPDGHPNASFPSTEHPDYLAILGWIEQGAPYDGDEPPIVEPEPEPNLPTNVDFFDNVQSRFAQAGCVTCHNAVELSGNMDLTGTPYEVYQRLTNPAYTRVEPYDYEASYLYTKPNAAYPNVLHEGGKLIPNAEDDFARYVAGWIYEGAVFQDPGPVDFDTTVVPLFGVNGLGCTTCHNQANQANYGNLALDGTPEQIYNELVVEAQRVVPGDAMASPILMKSFDLFPDVVHTGGKKAMQTYYKQYHRIATWIYEGAQP